MINYEAKIEFCQVFICNNTKIKGLDRKLYSKP